MQKNENGIDLDQKIGEFSSALKKAWELVPDEMKPQERNPTILVCGVTGGGKTTTINTLFGEQVGKVGHFERGTDKDEVYEWVSYGENINIIDLPGLGDSPTNDIVFKKIYRERLIKADGVIVVVAPPRPAAYATIKTINLLISCGVKSKHIVFAYNKLSEINYTSTDGTTKKVDLDGLIGPVNDESKEAILQAKAAFIKTLGIEIKNQKFSEEQVVEYDSQTGWNLHNVLFRVVDKIPFYSALRFRRATLEAEKVIRKKEEERLKVERDELDRKKKELEFEKKKLAKHESDLEFSLSKKDEDIKKREKKLKDRQKALTDFEDSTEKYEKSLFSIYVNKVSKFVEEYSPTAAKIVKEVGKNIEGKVKKFWEKAKSWFG